MSRVTAIELDYRQSGWIEVSLLWDRDADELIVSVRDAESGEAFELTVENNAKALDVFYHPYDYAPKPAAAAARTREQPIRSARLSFPKESASSERRRRPVGRSRPPSSR
jgi:hypothetical protein